MIHFTAGVLVSLQAGHIIALSGRIAARPAIARRHFHTLTHARHAGVEAKSEASGSFSAASLTVAAGCTRLHHTIFWKCPGK